MAPHLLDLPGEIRNRIYKYALTQIHGLVYCEEELDGQRTGSLYVHRKEQEEDVLESIRYLFEAYDAENATIMDANQLRFVNHQLHRETKGLSIWYNKITFLGPEHWVYSLCASFLNSLSPAQKGRLHILTLAPNREDEGWGVSPFDVITLGNFCHEYADAQVHFLVSTLQQDRDSFLVTAVALASKARRFNKYIKLIVMDDESLKNQLADCFRWYGFGNCRRSILYPNDSVYENKNPLPDNLRFFPADEVFDERLIRRTHAQSRRLIVQRVMAIEGGMDRWIEVAKDIFKNGV